MKQKKNFKEIKNLDRESRRMHAYILEQLRAAFLDTVGGPIRLPNICTYTADIENSVPPFPAEQLNLTAKQSEAHKRLNQKNYDALVELYCKADPKWKSGLLPNAVDHFDRNIVTRGSAVQESDLLKITKDPEYKEIIASYFRKRILKEWGCAGGVVTRAVLDELCDPNDPEKAPVSYSAIDGAWRFLDRTRRRLRNAGYNAESMCWADFFDLNIVDRWIKNTQNKYPGAPMASLMLGLTGGNTEDTKKLLHLLGRTLRWAQDSQPADVAAFDIALPQSQEQVKGDYQNPALDYMFVHPMCAAMKTLGAIGFDLEKAPYVSKASGHGVERYFEFTEDQTLLIPVSSPDGTSARLVPREMKEGQRIRTIDSPKFQEESFRINVTLAGLEIVHWLGLPKINPEGHKAIPERVVVIVQRGGATRHARRDLR